MTRRLVLAVAAVAMMGSAGAIVLASSGSSAPPRPSLQRSALLAYESQLLPLVQDGGRVVQQGMKPALDDLRYKHIVPPPVIAQEGAGWITSLRAVKDKVQKVAAPSALSPAHDAFLESLDEYVAAATAFRAAALAPAGAGREAQIAEGIRQAERADATYDRGASALQQARHRLGLPIDPNFPEVSGG